MRRCLVVFLLILSGCGLSEANPTVQPSDVSSQVELEMIGVPEDPVGIFISDLEKGDTTWALQRLDLQGVGRNFRISVHLPATSFVLDDTSIMPADDNARSVELLGDDRLEVIIRVGPDGPLRTGLHLVNLELPITATRLSAPVGNPYMGRLEIKIRNRVLDPTRRQQTKSFCDEAVPLMDFRIPTSLELNTLVENAEQNLTDAQASEVGRHALKLADDADLFYAGVNNSLSADDLVTVISELCRTQLKAMGVTGSH